MDSAHKETPEKDAIRKEYEHLNRVRKVLDAREKQALDVLHDAYDDGALTIGRLAHVRETFAMCSRAIAAALVADLSTSK